MFPIENRADLEASEFAALARELAQHRSIKHAVEWLLRQASPTVPADMVTQDEFSHDVLCPWTAGRWLVYDVT